MPPKRSLRVAFIHPDLGIGGAERLVVDAAVGLQNKGHSVVLYTSHHDQNHCFQETRDGTLDVRIRGNNLFPRTLCGHFYIICAILRQLHLTCSLILEGDQYDIIFIDQLSTSVPILRLVTRAKVLFYCHFPDMLLTQRQSILKKLYRLPLDLLEEWTTGTADCIVVNSDFTARIFQQTFRSIKTTPHTLYPGIQLDAYDKKLNLADPSVANLKTQRKLILSINRYERKKNIALAIHAFAKLKDIDFVSQSEFNNLRLVIAGGYDKRVPENVEYHQELDLLARNYGLTTSTIFPGTLETPPHDTQVLFLCSFSEQQRTFLLSNTLCLLYTPDKEHFGIVPIEAMYARVPVIAVNSGGPTETILDGVTGFLCEPNVETWAFSIARIVTGQVDCKNMGERGRKRVENSFSLQSFIDNLELTMSSMEHRATSISVALSDFHTRSFALVVIILIFCSFFLYSKYLS
ncbi:uncharacterized protein VTP21DRAFT_1373 [Calcarisporiella thermophila]|uniref:uncharacterized protein n=1 Tax=Calcarisporiella thermophila TaxID=911321 RepID=UPI003743D982